MAVDAPTRDIKRAIGDYFAGRHKSRWPKGIAGGLMYIAFGMIFVGAGAWIARTSGPIPGGVETTGTIVGSVPRSGEGYLPVIDFTTPDGVTHNFTDTLLVKSRPKIGRTVRVSYDPSDPERARNLSSRHPVLPWVLVGVGAPIVV